MAESFPDLLAVIARVFPTSRLTPVGEAELAAIVEQCPGVPAHYLAFLREVGWGRLGNGNFMIYSGPCGPTEFFDAESAALLDGIVFFGDDFSGWMAGFDTRAGWRMVGVDSASLSPYPEQAETIAEFVAKRASDFGAT